ncbi:MAG: PilT/PilU family type 4a pilus ATPase [Verrucomicrobiota bacterium]
MHKDVTEYLRETVNRGGSDLHLSAWAPACCRVHGSIQPIDDERLDPATLRSLILDTLSEGQRAQLEQELELDFALQLEDTGRFRGNVHVARGNIEASFRFISPDVPELASLGHAPAVTQFCNIRAGLVLVTGVTGSGKSTTLASMINHIADTRSGVIITLEDPIEYVLSHRSSLIKQREMGGDTKSFPRALRQALRQDPDVIVISELRDLDTIRIALTAAETGHLVLATLHTADAPQTVDRIIDVFPADQQQQIITQFAATLEGIVCQRLLPRADGQGRVLATEVLVNNHGIRNCIRDRKFEQIVGLMEIGAREGNVTIDHSLAALLNAGLITREEALFHCRERRTFAAPPAPEPKKPKSIWT